MQSGFFLWADVTVQTRNRTGAKHAVKNKIINRGVMTLGRKHLITEVKT
jgi:hypothetical protein